MSPAALLRKPHFPHLLTLPSLWAVCAVSQELRGVGLRADTEMEQIFRTGTGLVNCEDTLEREREESESRWK